MFYKLKYIFSLALIVWSFGVLLAQASSHNLGSNILDANGTVYTVTRENGQTTRRPYTSAGAYLSYGFNSWGNLVRPSSEDLSIALGSTVPPQDGKIICSDRGSDKGTCYLISLGTKIGFPSAQIFKAQGFSFASALYGDTSFLKYTANINNAEEAHKPGVLINLHGTVYLVGPNGLKAFTNATVFKSWGHVFSDVVKANTADETLPIVGTVSARQPGQFAVALETTSSQVCVPSSEVGGVDGCVVFNAIEKNDITFCEQITSQEWKGKCYSAFLPASGDIFVNCKKLSDATAKTQCQETIEQASKDAKLFACDRLPTNATQETKDACYYTYALVNADKSLCQKISESSIHKTTCEEKVEQGQKLSWQNNKPPTLAGKFLAKISNYFVPKAHALTATKPLLNPVAGRFLPGVFDIYTPTPLCGVLVSVAGSRPGVFVFAPSFVYGFFYVAPFHVGTNLIGQSLGVPGSPCPPILYMFSSSLLPSR